MCTPLVAGLRAAGHTLGIALSNRNAGIFARGTFAFEHVLERIPWPRHGSTPETAARARAEIAASEYDAAIVVSEEPEAYELALPIVQRVGFTTGWGKPLKSLWVRRRLTHAVRRGASVGSDARHEVEAIFALGAPFLGAKIPTRDQDVLRALVLGERGRAPRERIVMQVGPKWTTIGVPRESVATIARELAARGALIIASADEADAARALVGAVPLTLVAQLDAWKLFIDAARIVVTPDTGAAHLAGMLGVPVVDVFPDADAAAQIARWRPWAACATTLRACDLRGADAYARIEAALDVG